MWDQLLQADEGQLAALDGVWQDPLDELLVIDTDRMEYMAYSSQSRGVASGTLADAHDGRGSCTGTGSTPSGRFRPR